METSTTGLRQRMTPTSHRMFGIALIALGAGLIVNSLLGPFIADAIEYPFSESVLNQMIGLEAFSLVLVAPLSWSAAAARRRGRRTSRRVCIFAGVLAVRRHPAAPLVAFGPAAYTTYMFLQYVVGPEYRYYPGVLPLHLALFVLGTGIAVAAWTSVHRELLPGMTRRSERRYGVLLLALAAFIVSRYLPALFAALRGDPLTAEFRDDVSMYWTIFLLDLGIVVPATIAAAVALIRGTDWAGKALYAVFGWFALVPPSVAAMSIVMVANDDPNASAGQAIVFTIVAVVFAAFAVRLFRTLFEHDVGEAIPAPSGPSDRERRSSDAVGPTQRVRGFEEAAKR